MTEQLQQLLALDSASTQPLDFLLNLVLAAVMSTILAFIYRTMGRSMSDRSSFARNFFVLTTTTLLIITVVKSSLALSLGLVGALSIVRFRSAIKDPEELTFLFLAIAVGLGLGANQRLVVGIGFVFIVAVFVGRHLLFRPSGLDAYHLVVNVSSTVDIDSIVKLVGEHASRNMLKRLDDGDRMELAFAVSFKGTAEIAALRTGIKKLDSTAKTTFLDLEGLIR